jgi:hypothetical protein
MDGFKTLPKMQCFKSGGSVKRKEYCGGGKAYEAGGHVEEKEMKEDVAQDKKLIKKAVAMHDKQEHPGEKTDLSSLRKGGRAKKEAGTVKKYKAGGSTAYGAKKTAEDKKAIAKVKRTVPKKAEAPSAPVAEMGPEQAFARGGNPTAAPLGMAQDSGGLGRATGDMQPQPGFADAAYKMGGGVHVHHHYAK